VDPGRYRAVALHELGHIGAAITLGSQGPHRIEHDPETGGWRQRSEDEHTLLAGLETPAALRQIVAGLVAGVGAELARAAFERDPGLDADGLADVLTGRWRAGTFTTPVGVHDSDALRLLRLAGPIDSIVVSVLKELAAPLLHLAVNSDPAHLEHIGETMCRLGPRQYIEISRGPPPRIH